MSPRITVLIVTTCYRRVLICVLINTYTAYGFLGSKEIKAAGAGNLGLRDRKHFILLLTSLIIWFHQSDMPWNGFRTTSTFSGVVSGGSSWRQSDEFDA